MLAWLNGSPSHVAASGFSIDLAARSHTDSEKSVEIPLNFFRRFLEKLFEKKLTIKKI